MMTNHPPGVVRLVALLGNRFRVAKGLDLNEEYVRKLLRDPSKSPIYMEAVAELLEEVPPKHWPTRWREDVEGQEHHSNGRSV